MDYENKYMDYKNKYIKYKNKYIILKNQYGNGYLDYRAPACYYENNEHYKKILNCDHINFNNTIGTCWMISIFTVFLSSDSTSKCVQHILSNKDSHDIYNNIYATTRRFCCKIKVYTIFDILYIYIPNTW